MKSLSTFKTFGKGVGLEEIKTTKQLRWYNN